MNLRDQITQQIQDQNITPLPLWVHWLRRLGLLFLILLMTLFGGLMVGLFLEVLDRQSWSLVRFILSSDLLWLLLFLPVLWLSMMLLSWYIFSRLWRQTTTGHRLHPFFVVGSSLLMSLILGYSASVTGIAASLDERGVGRIPLLRSALEQEIRLWYAPEEGRLIGVLARPEKSRGGEPPVSSPEECCLLITPDRQIWRVQFPDGQEPATEERRPQGYRLQGQILEQGASESPLFRADVVESWKPPRREELTPRLRDHLREHPRGAHQGRESSAQD